MTVSNEVVSERVRQLQAFKADLSARLPEIMASPVEMPSLPATGAKEALCVEALADGGTPPDLMARYIVNTAFGDLTGDNFEVPPPTFSIKYFRRTVDGQACHGFFATNG